MSKKLVLAVFLAGLAGDSAHTFVIGVADRALPGVQGQLRADGTSPVPPIPKALALPAAQEQLRADGTSPVPPIPKAGAVMPGRQSA